MTRLACTLPGARPEVGPVNAPVRMRRRSAGAAFAGPSTIASMRHPPRLHGHAIRFPVARRGPNPAPVNSNGGGKRRGNR